MSFKITERYTHCHTATVIILMVGLGSAVTIYLTAGEAPVSPLAEFEKSKKFAYELERMGGKAAIIANDLNTWFAGLWQGTSLSYTVAAITVIIAAGYYFVASSLKEAQRKNRDGTGSA
ncbi:MAG: hypothetical protein WCP20_01770 [Desulfuromonadales bacterium]